MKKRILITGSNGLLGQKLVALLVEKLRSRNNCHRSRRKQIGC